MSKSSYKIQYKSKHCPSCGRVGRFHTFCSNACKQKAYRKRKQEIMLGNIAGTSSMLIDVIGMDAAMPVFEDLNKISGKDNLRHSAAAIEKIVYAINAIIVENEQHKAAK